MGERRSVEIAVVDLAGTTVRDPGIVETAVRHVSGTAFDESVFHRHRGGSKLDMLEALVGTDAAPVALAEFDDRVLAAVESGAVEALPGADDALAAITDAGIKVCLTTGFSSAVRQALVAHLGWDDRVDLSLSPGPGCRGRPHPDLILTAALRLEATAMASVAVVGDTANDVSAGRRAGAGIVVGVLTGANDRATLTEAGPDHVLEHIGRFADLITERPGSTPPASA
ncbi:MAG: HAD family hydrolase [Actinomycetota bacterium]